MRRKLAARDSEKCPSVPDSPDSFGKHCSMRCTARRGGGAFPSAAHYHSREPAQLVAGVVPWRNAQWPLLPDFHHPVAGVKASLNPRPHPVDRSKQLRGPAVAKANPDQSRLHAGPRREMEEVLVLAHDDHLAVGGVTPDLEVRRLREIHVEHMLTLQAAGSKKPRQRSRKLVIDEKPHGVCKTAWSA